MFKTDMYESIKLRHKDLTVDDDVQLIEGAQSTNYPDNEDQKKTTESQEEGQHEDSNMQHRTSPLTCDTIDGPKNKNAIQNFQNKSLKSEIDNFKNKRLKLETDDFQNKSENKNSIQNFEKENFEKENSNSETDEKNGGHMHDSGHEVPSRLLSSPKATTFPKSETTQSPKKYRRGYQSYPEDHKFFSKPGLFETLPDGGSKYNNGIRRSARLSRQVYKGTKCAIIKMLEAYNILGKHSFKAAAFIELAHNPFAADIRVPNSYEEATTGEHSEYWKDAISSEVKSLTDLGVFSLVDKKDLPENTNIIKGKWVYKVKPDKTGHIDRFKCRLCAKGFLQKYGVDYSATYSPVAKPTSIKLLLALAAKRKLKLRASDISTAFLFGELPEHECVYMKPPEGIHHRKGQVMKLHRCIYGLKQASRRFFEKLQGILHKEGYRPSRSDPCLYIKNTSQEFTIITVVVDDLLIASDSDINAKKVIDTLRTAGLKAKDLGFPEYIIGMHIEQDKDGNITLNQKLYIETLLRRFNMMNCKTSETPADTNVKLHKGLSPTTNKEMEKMNGKPYRSLVGALLYVVLTRPDIAVAVNECCRHMQNPGMTMWTAAKRILRYIKGTLNYKLCFNTESKFDLTTYVDSSYAECKDSRRSRGGYAVYFGGSLISWKTTLQKRVALSTAESEYRAATEACKHIVWLRRLLRELEIPQEKPSIMYEDNQACIKMIENPVISERNKHIEIDCHFIRDHYNMENISITHIGTEDQIADILTKNLSINPFKRHRSKMLITHQIEGDCQESN